MSGALATLSTLGSGPASLLQGVGDRDSALARSQQSFASVLAGAARDGAEATEAAAREAAESLVAITLVQPILSQLRESSMAAPPFEPTPAEKQFRALQDARLAQDIVSRARFPLVEQVARGVLKQAGADAAPAADGQGGPHASDHTHP